MAKIDYMIVEHGVEFELPTDAQVIKIEPTGGPGTNYKVYYIVASSDVL